MLQCCLKDDRLSGRNRRWCKRGGGYLSQVAPPATGPDGPVGVACLKLDPHSGANLWHHESAFLLAGQRHARGRPCGRYDAADVGHCHQDAADLQGIDVVHDRAAVDAVVFGTFPHTDTVDTEEPTPPRDKLKLCLYSPRLMLWVTLFT